jgi:hypothetical protein
MHYTSMILKCTCCQIADIGCNLTAQRTYIVTHNPTSSACQSLGRVRIADLDESVLRQRQVSKESLKIQLEYFSFLALSLIMDHGHG